LGHAAHLLVNTEDAVVDIALATGFCDQAHFSRAFKAATGRTPTAFRRGG
jgi:transcriptional regulator GlxA family with amidase domain